MVAATSYRCPRSRTVRAGNGYGGRRKSPNSSRATSASKKAETASIQLAILNTVKGLYAPKPWAALVDFLGVGEHVAKHRIAGTRKFDAEDLAQLLWTDD